MDPASLYSINVDPCRMVTPIRLLALVFLVLSPLALEAQAMPRDQEPVRQVHWAMGSFFGTGWYQVDENRNAYILRIPPRQTLRESSIDAEGNRVLGIEILYVMSLGVTSLDEIPDVLDFDNYSTFSFTPGVQVEIPINPRWALRPFAHLGYGWETQAKEGAAIWYGGIRSRYRLSEGQSQWSLLNSIDYAGYKPEYEQRGQYGSIKTGLEFSTPLGSFSSGGDSLYLNSHLTYNWMWNKLDFHVDMDHLETVRDTWEIGLAIGKRDEPINIWFMSFEQIGLDYRFSSNGRFNAITLNFRSWFTE